MSFLSLFVFESLHLLWNKPLIVDLFYSIILCFTTNKRQVGAKGDKPGDIGANSTHSSFINSSGMNKSDY